MSCFHILFNMSCFKDDGGGGLALIPRLPSPQPTPQPPSTPSKIFLKCSYQGCNARKVISKIYASFVLRCTVSGLGGTVNTRRMSKPDMIHLSHKKSMKYSGHRKLLCELSKLSNYNAFNLLGY